MVLNSDVGTCFVCTKCAAVQGRGGRDRFRGWASAGPAATTFLRRTPEPVSDLRVDSPVTPDVGGFALAELRNCTQGRCRRQQALQAGRGWWI